MSAGRTGTAGAPGDEGLLLALDAYIDALAAPEALEGPALADPVLAVLVQRLHTLPELAWEEVAPLLRPPPPPLAGAAPGPALHRAAARTSRRHRRPSPAELVTAVVAALVVLVAVVAINAFSGQPPAHPRAIPAAWRLAGYIDQPAWTQVGPTAGPAASVTCVAGATCYADQPGTGPSSTVLEATVDGGATWTVAPLPAGTHLTSAPACSTAARCLVAGETGLTPGGAAPAVLATADGGASWSVEQLPAGIATIVDLACTSASDCTGAGYGTPTAGAPAGPAVGITTDDGGTSWSVAPLPGSFFVANPSGLSCVALSCVLGGTTSFSTAPTGSATGAGAVLYSTDGGTSWSPGEVPAGVARVQSISCAGPTRCTALADGPARAGNFTIAGPYGPTEVLVSSDGGRTWALSGDQGLPPSTLTSISCPTAEDCWAAGARFTSGASGTERGVIAVTHDGGASWSGEPLPATAAEGGTGSGALAHLDIEAVTSVSCPSDGTCTALGFQGSSATPAQQQIALSSSAG